MLSELLSTSHTNEGLNVITTFNGLKSWDLNYTCIIQWVKNIIFDKDNEDVLEFEKQSDVKKE